MKRNIKKLIVLMGDPVLKEGVAETMSEMDAVQSKSLYREPIKLLAEVLGQELGSFVDPKAVNEPFSNPPKVTPLALKKFALGADQKPLPVTFAGPTLKTPQDAIAYFFNHIANERWGKDWVAKLFFNHFAFVKEGVYLLEDADKDLDYLRDLNLKDDSVIAVNLERAENDETVFDIYPHGRVNLIVRYGQAEQDIKGVTVRLLKAIKTNFIDKR